MADSTALDVTKMKVIELRRELKSRSLPNTGDKSELVARLQAAIAEDEQHADINLDSDEIDSDGVLEDEDDKAQNDILEDSTVDTLNEELALSEQPSPPKPPAAKPARTLKRKIPEANKGKPAEAKPSDNKEGGTKKIVLNRNISITTEAPKEEEKKEQSDLSETETKKVKITADLDAKTRLEMRAKRFGLPVKIPDDARKEARKQRFGEVTTTSNISSSTSSTTLSSSGTLTENLDKLKKRAERFGQSVSKIMSDIEAKEKLEKRKAKFGTVK